jgi:hypothetical protein
MKRFILIFALAWAPFLSAAESEEETPPVPSLPPYEVGALPLASGLIIERSGQPDLNLRFVGGKLHLYWIDEDGLVTEPEATEVAVRFTIKLRGADYHRFVRLGNEAGFGTPHVVPKPHIYTGLLIIKTDPNEEPEVHNFRYTLEMDAVAAPPAS